MDLSKTTSVTGTVVTPAQDNSIPTLGTTEPSVPYTSADLNYGNADSRTSKEQNDATARSGIAGSLPSLTDYEIVYLGYPKIE